ncbi:MAG: AtzG-like protein [Pseudomonadota bacterium]
MPVPDDAALEAMMDAAAEALGLTIPPEARPGVVANLRALLAHAETAAADLDEAPLVEIAPVYRA